jgi:hypothetical protein
VRIRTADTIQDARYWCTAKSAAPHSTIRQTAVLLIRHTKAHTCANAAVPTAPPCRRNSNHASSPSGNNSCPSLPCRLCHTHKAHAVPRQGNKLSRAARRRCPSSSEQRAAGPICMRLWRAAAARQRRLITRNHTREAPPCIKRAPLASTLNPNSNACCFGVAAP